MNRHGQVTGTAHYIGANEQAYRWTPSTNTYKMLGSLGGTFTRPAALNDSGVVGRSMTDLGHPAGDNDTGPTDINDKGYIVGGTGYVVPVNGEGETRLSRGFVYSPATHKFRILASRSDQAALATDINVHGVIVGTSISWAQSDQALLWNACGKPLVVLLEGQYGTAAVGINRYEHVVGKDFQTATFWRRNEGRCQST